MDLDSSGDLPLVTPDEFKKWRNPRRGKHNPERMDNRFWAWCVRSKKSAYSANQSLAGPDSLSAGPCWSFDRFGQSSTQLPDGRVVHIAGEHEDYYDPDFYIYNDVVVEHNNGELEFYGYPIERFPPTDFHSATLLGSQILLIGNLGYEADRRPRETQVLQLDLTNWEVSKVTTQGDNPGWIHKQRVRISRDHSRLLLTGGLVEGKTLLENLDDWELSLDTWQWRKLTDRKWQRYVLSRGDKEMNNLWKMRQAVFYKDHPELRRDYSQHLESMAELPEDLRSIFEPPEATEDDRELIRTLYQPPMVGQAALEDEDDYGVYKLEFAGVTVRYNEGSSEVILTIEGYLSESVAAQLVSDLQDKLSRLEKCQYKVERY